MKITIELPDDIEQIKTMQDVHKLQNFMFSKEKFTKLLARKNIMVVNQGAMIDTEKHRALIRVDFYYNPPSMEEARAAVEAEKK